MGDKVIVDKAKLVELANHIRAKSGSSSLIHGIDNLLQNAITIIDNSGGGGKSGGWKLLDAKGDVVKEDNFQGLNDIQWYDAIENDMVEDYQLSDADDRYCVCYVNESGLLFCLYIGSSPIDATDFVLGYEEYTLIPSYVTLDSGEIIEAYNPYKTVYMGDCNNISDVNGYAYTAFGQYIFDGHNYITTNDYFPWGVDVNWQAISCVIYINGSTYDAMPECEITECGGISEYYGYVYIESCSYLRKNGSWITSSEHISYARGHETDTSQYEYETIDCDLGIDGLYSGYPECYAYDIGCTEIDDYANISDNRFLTYNGSLVHYNDTIYFDDKDNYGEIEVEQDEDGNWIWP